MKKVLAALFILTSGEIYAACPAAPVGAPEEPVIQLKRNADGKKSWGATNIYDATEEGALVWDDTNNAVSYCDGASWVTLGSGGSAAATELNDLSDAKYIGESVYVGSGAGNAVTVTTVLYNTALGYHSLYSNTMGNSNTASGSLALYSNTTGSSNTASGRAALQSNTTGSYNTASGREALYLKATGSYNTASGFNAGRYIEDGATANETSNNSLYLGVDTKALADGGTNEIVIGYNATGAGSNSVALGNDSIATTVLKGNVGFGTKSPSTTLHIHDSGYIVPHSLDVHAGIKVSATGTKGAGIELSDGSGEGRWLLFSAAAMSGIGRGGFAIWDIDAKKYRLSINRDGNVGIGTYSPSSKFHVNGEALADNWNVPSDRNLKDNIKRIQNAIEKLEDIEGVAFSYKKDGRAAVGVIA